MVEVNHILHMHHRSLEGGDPFPGRLGALQHRAGGRTRGRWAILTEGRASTVPIADMMDIGAPNEGIIWHPQEVQT